MARGALARLGRTTRKVNQAVEVERPGAGTERDGVTYGETVTLGDDGSTTTTKSTTKSSSTSTEAKS